MVLIPRSHSPQKSTDNANSTRMYISLLFQIHESVISAFAFQYFIDISFLLVYTIPPCIGFWEEVVCVLEDTEIFITDIYLL